MPIKKKRKPRKDRNHIIYKITIGKLVYIGVTVLNESTIEKTLRFRLRRHKWRASKELKDTLLCQEIRKKGSDELIIEELMVVRGKEQAHETELSLIHRLQPQLNERGRF